ncbi:hypothetical protein BLA39750_01267 [Burkholderia lata]|uniref:Uncharacterized protein n=1 Tax=Burkholderia lata (strain ATCC 17760 / DSM 23089 / LMG 22485 / NCIMB 9086 / R18194 / 383) TaxID=482957 RepID=A0A6P2VI17_BURL3|nr:hypothetical protein BLA39750_01267 [Burkholderia lata]
MNSVFDSIADLGLIGRITVTPYEVGGGLAAVERVPLLLSAKQETSAKDGRAQWLEPPCPAGWYMTAGSLYDALRPYVPTIAAPKWSVARTSTPCWKCHRDTRVYAVCVCQPAGWIYSTPDDPEWSASLPEATRDGRLDSWGMWEALPCATTCAYLTRLNGSAAKQLSDLCPAYRPDTSREAGGRYWMNHCEHCEAKQGDHFVHATESRPGLFLPLSDEGAAGIQFHEVESPLIARATLDFGDAPIPHLQACGKW